LKEDVAFDEQTKGEESEYWHAKSLEIACTFLPSDCPLLNHILLSYQKHHSPSQQTIKEDQENEQDLKIVKPLKGIENTKHKPIIRRIDADNVLLTPPDFSPAVTITNKMILSYQSFLTYGSQSMYQGNNKSNILDYSSNKDKSRNTGTTRHRSVSPNVVGESESFRSANSRSAIPDSNDKEASHQHNSVNSGYSRKKSSIGGPKSEKVSRARNSHVQYERQINSALLAEDFDVEDHIKPKTGKKKNSIKDSLLMDSMIENQHSTSYKEITNDDSLHNGMIGHDFSKINRTEDMGLNSFIQCEKKKQAKDKKLLGKLVDNKPSSNSKRIRPKSFKGIRSSHAKVNTMSNLDQNKSFKGKKVTNYLSNNMQGNRLRSKQSNRKKTTVLGARPSSGKDLRNPNSFHR